MQSKKSVIIIFGFSGSGKSTVAELLAQKLGLRVVHPSSILRNILEGKKINLTKTQKGIGFWETKKGMTLLKNRLSDKTPADMISDQYLLREINKGKVVMDSWSMPWLTKKGHKVFLQAPLQVRAERVAKRSKISVSEARKTIRAKDNDTRKLFKRIYGFDIARDHEVFDQKIDTHTQSAREITKLLAATIRPA